LFQAELLGILQLFCEICANATIMNRKLLTVLIFASGSLLSFGQEEIENNEITYRHGKFLGESIPLKNLPTAKDTEESEDQRA